MTRCAALAALIVLLAGCGSHGRVVVDERRGDLAGVRFGDTSAHVRAVLGHEKARKGFAPTRADRYTGPPAIPVARTPETLDYENEAYLVSPGFGVVSMMTVGDGARTRAGVSVGDHLDAVRAHYSGVDCGKTSPGEGEGEGYDWCRARFGRVRVFFGGDPIASITLTRIR